MLFIVKENRNVEVESSEKRKTIIQQHYYRQLPLIFNFNKFLPRPSSASTLCNWFRVTSHLNNSYKLPNSILSDSRNYRLAGNSISISISAQSDHGSSPALRRCWWRRRRSGPVFAEDLRHGWWFLYWWDRIMELRQE